MTTAKTGYTVIPTVSFVRITAGAMEDEEDEVHGYVGLAGGTPGPSLTGTVGSGDVERGLCFSANVGLGLAGSGGWCSSTGWFYEGGVGTPGASLNAFFVF